MGRTTTKREEILAFLQEFSAENGYAPSVREIMQAVGLKSTASVHYHLDALNKSGAINMDGSKNRAISVPGSAKKPGQIPVVGVVAAGVPILAVENIEGYLPWEGDDECFALRVKGDSMIEAGILPGDKIIVRPQQTADNGDIVVALLEEEATVKRLSRKDGKIWLLPENPNYAPIDGTNAAILGKVRGVVREYR